jgi:TRAP-type uncharacterized transport system substrate-binding protein
MKRNLKKVMALGMAAAMIFSLTACSGSKETNETTATTAAGTETTAAGDKLNLNATLLFATHEVGTSNYNLSAELSKLWEENGIGTVDVQPISPGGMGAPYLFEQGKADITFINGAPAKWASEDGTLGKEPTGGYSAMIGSLSGVSAVNFMTKAFIEKYNVTTIEEAIRQKLPIRIGCSPVGSMDNEVVQILLNFLGVTEDDVRSWGGDVIHGGGSDLSSMVKDGKLDFMLDHTSVQSSTMSEISMTSDVQFLQWEDATIDYFVNEKGFQRVTIPANSWKGQENEIVNPGTPDCLFVREDLDEEAVYQLTKIMCENRDYLVSVMASLEPFDPATCWESERVGGIALHPGAERYFKEMGYIK